MKTLELDLKKKIFIVDTTAPVEAIEIDDYEFLCKGSELTEEIASELVKTTWIHDKKILCKYKNYNSEGDGSYFSAVKSFKSAIESKWFYWLENPISRPRNYELWAKYGDYTQYGKVLTEKCLKWQEAEEKTFKNPLIFVKK